MKKLFTGIEITEGALIPKGYGIAYWETGRDVAVCYPLPFNFVVSTARAIYRRLVVPTLCYDRYTKEILQTRRKGYDKGWKAGYAIGYRDGAGRKPAKEER